MPAPSRCPLIGADSPPARRFLLGSSMGIGAEAIRWRVDEGAASTRSTAALRRGPARTRRRAGWTGRRSALTIRPPVRSRPLGSGPWNEPLAPPNPIHVSLLARRCRRAPGIAAHRRPSTLPPEDVTTHRRHPGHQRPHEPLIDLATVLSLGQARSRRPVRSSTSDRFGLRQSSAELDADISRRPNLRSRSPARSPTA